MAPFRYRLHTLLNYRQARLAQWQQAYAQASQHLLQCQQQVAQLQQEQQQCEQALNNLTGKSGLPLAATLFIRELLQRLGDSEQALQQAQREQQHCHEACTAAQIALKQLEKHRERQRLLHRYEQQRHEYQQMDEAEARRQGSLA
ncbi:flagellar FliJ family protein [Neisseriaceae bacterium TC5R-5]|nr:flagellar FliJ family protein [Neisseriaceae bacterium TC5R-5]